MAEGGGEMLTAHTEETEMMCEVCLEEDSFKKADFYCTQCRQRLCEKCRNYHKKLAATRSHQLIQAHEAPPESLTSQEEVSDEIRTPMCQTHKDKELEYFCGDHSVPLCASCKLVDHRNCNNIQDLEQAAAGTRGQCEEVLEYLQAIDTAMKDIKLAIDKENGTMETHREYITDKIKQKVKQLENLGQKKISEVDAIFKKAAASLAKEKDEILHSQSLVSKSIQELETVTKAGTSEEIFLAAKHAEKEARKYQDILNDTSFITHTEIGFEISSNLEAIDSYGDITCEKTKIQADHQPCVVNDLKVDAGGKPVWFFDILSTGQWLVLLNATDMTDSQLILYTANGTILSKLDLPGGFLSAVLISDRQIFIPLFDTENGFQEVNIDKDKLTLGNIIKTKLIQIAVTAFSNSSVLTIAQSEYGDACCQIIDLSGQVQKHIPLHTEKLKTPAFIRASKDRKAIYILDDSNGCFGFSITGDLMFQYVLQNFAQYMGLVVVHSGFISFACESDKIWCIIQLSSAGKYRKQILKTKDAFIYPLKHADNKLYVMRIDEVEGTSIAHLVLT